MTALKDTDECYIQVNVLHEGISVSLVNLYHPNNVSPEK